MIADGLVVMTWGHGWMVGAVPRLKADMRADRAKASGARGRALRIVRLARRQARIIEYK